MKKTFQYIQDNKDRFLEELFDLLRIPSISAKEEYKPQMIETAEFIAKDMKKSKLDNVKVYPTAGNPIVFGEKIIDKSLPTILIYGHYDVMPVDPVDLWDTEPFEPVIKDGKVYGRGSADDKGQFFMHSKAVEAMIATDELPCNVKFMIEGEEEIGSVNLGIFCNEHKDLLSCDTILISDTSLIDKDTPSITTGLRGLSYIEVEVVGPNIDLHSGLFGGAVHNPLNYLAKMIGELHDENNHITIPGFYDDVEEVSLEERKEMNKAPFNLEDYKNSLEIGDVWGEKGFTTLERTSIRPTLDVNGMWGGYIEPGTKTVLPSKAFAKISMRLVPNQDPDKITELVKNYLESNAPNSVKVTVKPHHGGKGYVTPTNSKEYMAGYHAMLESFGEAPIPFRSGGSIPIVSLFEEVLGVKSVLLGFGLSSDAIHSPNEHYGLWNFYKGIDTIPRYFKYYSK